MKTPKTDRTSEAYRRITCAGFKIGEPRVHGEIDPLRLRLVVEFNCVCGRSEVLTHVVENDKRILAHRFPGDLWDVARELERIGSVSVDHLRKDGYSEEQIKQIRYVYDLEEEVTKLRRLSFFAPDMAAACGVDPLRRMA